MYACLNPSPIRLNAMNITLRNWLTSLAGGKCRIQFFNRTTLEYTKIQDNPFYQVTFEQIFFSKSVHEFFIRAVYLLAHLKRLILTMCVFMLHWPTKHDYVAVQWLLDVHYSKTLNGRIYSVNSQSFIKLGYMS